MEYGFDSVKSIYDRYDICQNLKTKEFSIFDKKNNNMYSFTGSFAEKVKFAHTWMYATKYGQSSSSTISYETTKEEYERAFSDTLRDAYNEIIAVELNIIHNIGRMGTSEAVKKGVGQAHYAHIGQVIDGLYSKPKGLASFEMWCKEIAKEYTVDEWLSAVSSESMEYSEGRTP